MPPSDPDFSVLYAEHLDFVWRNLRALGVPASDLEDAVQDTFVVAYRRRADFIAGASMRGWLYGIARRVAYRQRRGGGRRRRLADAVAREPQAQSSLDDVVAFRAAWAEAMRVLDGLPPLQREAYWLTEIEGLTAAAAGAALGVSGNTVSSRLRSARQALDRSAAVRKARAEGELQRAARAHTEPTASQRRRASAAILVQLSSSAAPLVGGVKMALAGVAAAIMLGGGALAVTSESTPAPSEVTQGLPGQPAAAAKPRSGGTRTPEPLPRRPDAPLHGAPPTAGPAVALAQVSTDPGSERARRGARDSAESAKEQPLTPVSGAAAPSDAVEDHGSSLVEEARWVRSLKSTLQRNPTAALDMAAGYAGRFPDGVLDIEVAALRVQALCRLGRQKQAETAANALPGGHAWATIDPARCPGEKNPTKAEGAGEGEGI
ncbi:MAG: sigma-70 family RNA polymerase sigma factor [Myxococcota bacterium]